MPTKMPGSSALSAFCESMAILCSAGIQNDEAVSLLAESMEDEACKKACILVYSGLIKGASLGASLEDTRCFPSHLVDMVKAGEHAGRLENVLQGLADYYGEKDRLQTKVKSALTHSAALLAIMSVILLFAVVVILPAFIGGYEDVTGNLVMGSFSYGGIATFVGWAALIATLACTALALVGRGAASTADGQQALVHLLKRTPFARGPLRQLSVARFAATLATFVSAGIDTDSAMRRALPLIDHPNLKRQIEQAYAETTDPSSEKSLAQAISDHGVLDPLCVRVLVVEMRSGSLETALSTVSSVCLNDSIAQIDRIIDGTAPTLTAFLTASMGAMLIAVMLPLVGIMGSIG